MKTSLLRTAAAALACLLILWGSLPAAQAAPSHGTADTWITEDQLNNIPPASYNIDKATQASGKEGKYNAWFPKQSIQTVSIQIDENNLNYLLQNAREEGYVMTTSVTIGDTTLGYCGLRTKGNYTLSHSYTDNPGSDRFSFTVNFGEYITKELYGQKQNFYGCDRISFNNFFFDKSMMKEFFALQLMEEMGLPTPQHCLAKLYINGDYYGVYAMIEAHDTPILEQYFGLSGSELSSYLCKPTGTNLLYNQISKDPSPLYEYNDETYTQVEDMLPTAIEWVRRINCLSSGTDFDGNALDVNSQAYLDLLAQVVEVEEAVKYFATHSWLCQMDNMFTVKQNFGLYLSPEGVATLVPWDYDLAFGCYYPSTAEATANYPLDVMFQLDPALFSQSHISAPRYYSNYPLFNIIYQNDALRQMYRDFMTDCSRIAALGGTVDATGKSYDPGYFHSFLTALEEQVVEAASEELADNVYYMNHISQPRDVVDALPNLSSIIALRSVGVYVQAAGLDTTVCGSVCNLEALGNGMRGNSSNAGRLTTVDAATGIFVTSNYSGGRRTASPSLVVSIPQADEAVYKTVRELSGCGRSDTLLVYQLSAMGKASGGYTVTVPLAMEHLQEGKTRQFYTFEGGKLTALDTSQDGNLFTATADTLSYIAVVVTAPPVNPAVYILTGVGAAAVVAAAVLLGIRARKKETDASRSLSS